MEMTTEQKLPLRAFLEDTLGLGEPVKSKSLTSILDGDAAKFYSGYEGYITASLNAINSTRWHQAVHLSDAGVVLLDILHQPRERITDHLRKGLAMHGLAMEDDQLHPMIASQLERFINAVRDLDVRRFSSIPGVYEMRSSISLTDTQLPSGFKNWDLTLRVMVLEPKEQIYIEYHLPKVVRTHTRLIRVEQVERAASKMLEFLTDYKPEASALLPFASMNPAELAAHFLANDPTYSAEKIWEAYHDAVKTNSALFHRNFSLNQAAQEVVSWVELGELRQKIWLNAVELCRIHIQMSMQYLKHQALNGV